MHLYGLNAKDAVENSKIGEKRKDFGNSYNQSNAIRGLEMELFLER